MEYILTHNYYNRFFEIFIKVTIHRVEPYTLCKFWYKRYYPISIPEYPKPSGFLVKTSHVLYEYIQVYNLRNTSSQILKCFYNCNNNLGFLNCEFLTNLFRIHKWYIFWFLNIQILIVFQVPFLKNYW